MRRAAAVTAGTRASRVYLAACCALLVRAVVDVSLVQPEGHSKAMVVPLLVTAPSSVVLHPLAGAPLPGDCLMAVVAALVNAAVFNGLVRLLRRRPART